MADVAKKDIARAVLETRGRTFAQDAGISVERNTPSPLFELLCLSILSSTRISHDIALNATKALIDHGWTTPKKMADATWRQRTDVLNRAGYARYDESTSRMLEETARLVDEEWSGDLRHLREEAERDPKNERKLLKRCKGMGDVGVDIFFREVQVAWEEVRPFADKRAMKAAERLGLGKDPKEWERTVGKKDFPRLVSGLARVELDGLYDEVEAKVA